MVRVMRWGAFIRYHAFVSYLKLHCVVQVPVETANIYYQKQNAKDTEIKKTSAEVFLVAKAGFEPATFGL